ncbi:MAG: hypothetical protein NVSMB19_08850 [Vulcanimicrobiaceae bacterium]
MERPHEPPAHDPAGIVALGPGALVRDATGGATVAFDAWIEARMAAESRTRDECREELLNAIARGDVTIERSGDPLGDAVR